MNTKSLFIIFSCLFISLTSLGQDFSEKQVEFANDFVAAVRTHNEKKTMKFLDKTYRKEQLKILEGDKMQLVNELFSGQDLENEDSYLNFKIKEITKIEIVEVIQLKGTTECTYIFKVARGEQEIYAALHLAIDGKKYGFVGAMG